uniref:Uncharacterized protein n=1 Tax=uncultured bacterium contig00038 TaxID=1181526 RepID=A0A806K104_9BACT|nr:hypothetical protein [uncultured bacterium contig00038]
MRGNTKDETTVLDKIKERKYTFDYVIEALKNIRKNTVDVCGVESSIVTEPNQEQKRILKLLGVNL